MSPQGPTPKRSHAIGDGDQSSSSSVPVGPSLTGLEAPDHGKGAEDVARADTGLEMGGEARHLVLEALEGEGRDLLQRLLIGVDVEHLVPLAPRSEPSEAEEAGVARGHRAEEADTTSMARDASLVPD